MQYKCDVCHDSGSKNQTGDYLDCPACDMPMIRKALNDFVKSLGPTHPEDVALAIHQRALAMAPKQEAPAGWKLVPIEPTQAMFAQARTSSAGSSHEKLLMLSYWRNMIAAVPAAPADTNGALTDSAILPDEFWNLVADCGGTKELGKNARLLQEWVKAYGKSCAALSGAKGN